MRSTKLQRLPSTNLLYPLISSPAPEPLESFQGHRQRQLGWCVLFFKPAVARLTNGEDTGCLALIADSTAISVEAFLYGDDHPVLYGVVILLASAVPKRLVFGGGGGA
ncbi:uncharacterized protein VTP21DRAFT_623 [Calcarisporiella thermophila]|uniref:uncharacterized protein n=1 Tax=Calcarisporiella thermophila TaxID=911321 RepID=UPI0037429ECB